MKIYKANIKGKHMLDRFSSKIFLPTFIALCLYYALMYRFYNYEKIVIIMFGMLITLNLKLIKKIGLLKRKILRAIVIRLKKQKAANKVQNEINFTISSKKLKITFTKENKYNYKDKLNNNIGYESPSIFG